MVLPLLFLYFELRRLHISIASVLAFSDLTLHGQRIGNRLERDFSRAIHFNAQQEWASLLSLENARFLCDDMQHRVVSHTLVDKWNVYGGGQLFVNVQELLHQVGSFVLERDEPVGDFAKTLDKVRR